MIFVTTGTDHHPFDRLIKEVDRLKGKGLIQQEVFAQTGTSRYKPRFCEFAEYISFDQMMEKIKKASIIITHGGPASIMPVIYLGKIPIVVPRKSKLGEHVDDHQVRFTEHLGKRGQILLIDKIDDLEFNINNYESLAGELKAPDRKEDSLEDRILRFADALERICRRLTETKRRKNLL